MRIVHGTLETINIFDPTNPISEKTDSIKEVPFFVCCLLYEQWNKLCIVHCILEKIIVFDATHPISETMESKYQTSTCFLYYMSNQINCVSIIPTKQCK